VVPWWVLPWSGDVRRLWVVSCGCSVVFADGDGGGVVDIGGEQAPVGDAELAGPLRVREIDGGFHGSFGVL
jgi:hypothetical protein